MGEPNPPPALKIKGTDPRATMYGEIARCHASLMEAKWKAQTTGVPMQLTPMGLGNLTMHCETSIAL